MEQVALSAARANEALASALSPAQRLTAEFQLAREGYCGAHICTARLARWTANGAAVGRSECFH